MDSVQRGTGSRAYYLSARLMAMLIAALTSKHTCPMQTPGVPTILTGGKPIAHIGSTTAHGGTITSDLPTVTA